MNACITLSAAFVAGTLFVFAPAQAQAANADNTQKSQAKIEAMQAQIKELQAQVKQLEQQVIRARQQAGLPNIGVSPFYRVPNSPLPNLTLPNKPRAFAVPQPHSRYSNIPDSKIILLKQAAR